MGGKYQRKVYKTWHTQNDIDDTDTTDGRDLGLDDVN